MAAAADLEGGTSALRWIWPPYAWKMAAAGI